MRIDTDAGEGEFGHVRATDQDGARRAEPRHNRRVMHRRRAITEGLRPGQGALARYVEQVLQRNR